LKSWARFWHPSPFLAKILSHKDLVGSPDREFGDLLKVARKRIEDRLKALGWIKVGNGRAQVWQVLAELDLTHPGGHGRNPFLDGLSDRRSPFSSEENEERAAPYSDLVVKLIDFKPKHEYSKDSLEALALIALSSPSVCLLRTLYSLPTFTETENEPDRNELELIVNFCCRQWRAFFNRASSYRVIKAQGGRGAYSDKLQNYLKDGNIQALLDEYVSMIHDGPGEKPLLRMLARLSHTLGSRQSTLQVRRPGKRKSQAVNTEMIKAFGSTEEESGNRESVREGFNSPFWPFVLATTSVGQEGLDFHLYCKDVFHWNLPFNPVSFEQREGRINRYNALWVREAVSASVPAEFSPPSGALWRDIFEYALSKSKVADRLSLGLSPHWTFNSGNPNGESQGYVRHVLSLPGSEEEPRYDRLMENLELYRLTLGQPNQASFLNKLRQNAFLKNRDNLKGVMICLFPSDAGYHQKAMLEEYQKRGLISLADDAKEQLDQLGVNCTAGLRKLVKEHISRIGLGQNEAVRLKSAKALIYFLDPFDEVHDRIPGMGWKDDVEFLEKGLT
jgi:hypothetical protein